MAAKYFQSSTYIPSNRTGPSQAICGILRAYQGLEDNLTWHNASSNWSLFTLLFFDQSSLAFFSKIPSCGSKTPENVQFQAPKYTQMCSNS